MLKEDFIFCGSVESEITDNILLTWERCKTNPSNLEESEACTNDGIQTSNILLLSDFQNFIFQDSLNKLLLICERILRCNLRYFHVHIIEYFDNGYQDIHNHKHNEDFSLILYLNDCNRGETFFDSGIVCIPKKDNIVLFSSSLDHGGNHTSPSDNKKVLVCGFRRTFDHETEN